MLLGSIILNVILIIYAVLLYRELHKNIFDSYDIITDDTIRIIHEIITDTINVSTVTFDSYEEFKWYNIFSVYYNVFVQIEYTQEITLADLGKIILYEKIIEIFNNEEIEEQLYKKFQDLKEELNIEDDENEENPDETKKENVISLFTNYDI